VAVSSLPVILDGSVSAEVNKTFDNVMGNFGMRLLIAMLGLLLVTSVFAKHYNADVQVYPPADLASSLSKWRKLAEQGKAIAQYNLGISYEYGRGARQNDVEAVKWYKKASEQGLVVAQYRLGVMYENGWGIPSNDIEAVKWYSIAAEQGHLFAQHDLAFMYAAGTGVAQDYVRAYMWLTVAATNGNRLMIKHLNSVSDELTSVQIEEAEKMAREWMKQHQQRHRYGGA